jgi:hypothetical protein
MRIREDREVAIKKLAPLNERLDRQYGLSIDMTSDTDHLRKVLEHYQAKREMILSLQGETGAMHNQSYTKAVMISEMVRLFLREIAPKRSRKRKSQVDGQHRRGRRRAERA